MKKAKLLSLLLTGVLLLESAGGSSLVARAAEQPGTEVTETETAPSSEAAETETAPSSEAAETEIAPSSEVTETEIASSSEATETETASQSETAKTEETSSPKATETQSPASESAASEETSTEDESSGNVFDIFPGLGDDYTLSASQLEDKQDLFDHVGDIGISSLNAKNYPDAEGIYVPGEVVYLADTGDEAQMVAEAFGGELDSYSYGVAVIRLPKDVTVALAVAASANARINLPAVWPNYYSYIDTADTSSHDPLLGGQWHHDYIGTSYAWAAGYKGQGIKVAVVDTGVDKNHEDLNDNAVTGRNFVGGKDGSGEGNGEDILTDYGTHGTHVAGIIAAQEDNGKGGAGIAPDATVKGYNALGKSGGGTTDSILRSVNAAVEDGNVIINMSLGGDRYSGVEAEVYKKTYEAGVAIFAAAGNENTDGQKYPATYYGVICVGAVDQNSARTYFSNYGETVDLSFPGMHILSTYPMEKGNHETNDNYGYMNGTSQATPTAAGTAAVILSANPDILSKTGTARVDALLNIMKSSTTKSTSPRMGAGTTWLPGVLNIATEQAVPDAPVIAIAETPSSKGADTYLAEKVTVTLSALNDIKDIKGIWEIWYSVDGKAPAYKDGKVTNATKYTGSFEAGGTGKVSIKAIVINPATGKVSRLSSKNCVLTPVPADVTITAAGNISRVAAGKTLRLAAAVTPTYAISNKVEWSVADEATKNAGITVDSKGTVKTSSSTPASKEGETYKVKATAVGPDGARFDGVSAEYSFTVFANANIKKITLTDKTATLNVGGETKNLLTSLSVTKQDNSTLVGEAAKTEVVWSSSNTKVATVDGNGVVTANAPGKAVIKATSNDGANKSAPCTVTVKQPVTRITLRGATKVAAGKSTTLTARVEPANATDKKLEWTLTENPGNNFTVKNGKLTAKRGATGTCTVTATAKDGSGVKAEVSHTVTVVSEAITKITLDKRSLKLFIGQQNSSQLTATVAGKEGYDKSLVEWSSSSPRIASVDQNGLVTANGAGKATITCAATDGSNKKAVCTVNVSIPMSKLNIGLTDSWGVYLYRKDNTDPSNEYLGYIAQGKSIKMSARYSSAYGEPTNKKIRWKSDDRNILKVDGNGKVTAVGKPGDWTYIRAEALDGSNVVSNEYCFVVKPSYDKLVIEKETLTGGSCMFIVSGMYDGKKYPINYFTVTVSGGKNPNVSQGRLENGFEYLVPMAGDMKTTDKDLDQTDIMDLTKQDCQEMQLTIKLMDGSGLTASKTVYALRVEGEYFCPDHLNE